MLMLTNFVKFRRPRLNIHRIPGSNSKYGFTKFLVRHFLPDADHFRTGQYFRRDGSNHNCTLRRVPNHTWKASGNFCCSSSRSSLRGLLTNLHSGFDRIAFLKLILIILNNESFPSFSVQYSSNLFVKINIPYQCTVQNCSLSHCQLDVDGLVGNGNFILLQGGAYLVTFLTTYGPGISVIFVVFVEAAAVCWFYGAKRFSGDIERMIGKQPHAFWKICWTYISPMFILVGNLEKTWIFLRVSCEIQFSLIHKTMYFVSIHRLCLFPHLSSTKTYKQRTTSIHIGPLFSAGYLLCHR